MPLRVGIVVGELSGDNLGTDLIRALKQQHPDLIFEGVLGPGLIQEGGKALYSMERLSVTGIIEPLSRLPELYQMRKHLYQHFKTNPPDVFIGIDAPDFNLGLEKKLKEKGIKTVHYVSPSVWAWRQGRIQSIKKSVDTMLTLFPFEAQFYEKHQVPVCFTGHPLADQIPLDLDPSVAKKALGYTEGDSVLAILPGSRWNEIRYLSETYLQACQFCYEKNPHLKFMMPLVSLAHQTYIEGLKEKMAPHLPLQIVLGKTPLALQAAQAVLVASGTATLEILLYQKPMVVAYKMHPWTYKILKKLVKTPYIALPNLLANERLVPEYIQEAATPEALGKALLSLLSPQQPTHLINRFREIHLSLKKNASVVAAKAILALIDSKN